MSQLWIEGGHRLSGELTVQGAKNGVLPILAATVLTRGVCALENCPCLRDVEASIRILRHLGCGVQWEKTALVVDTTAMTRQDIPDELMREMRSSVIFMGAILGRSGKAELSYPGGCELGPRPIDLHLWALKKLGAQIEDLGGRLCCSAGILKGTELTLAIASVGATENAILAAVGAQETTVIYNAAREPEIVELQRFLNACGACISGAGSSTVVIRGGKSLHGCTHRCMGDRIVAATYLCAAASAGGEVCLTGVDYRQLSTVIAVLSEAGCQVKSDECGVRLECSERLRAVRPVRTAPYPGFPTDAQAVLMAAMLRSKGTTVFVENIFDNRYRHVDELIRMGADIRTEGRVAVVSGVEQPLCGAALQAADLRGGAALAVAALGAEGVSTISRTEHIDRGYEDLARDLSLLGGRVRKAGD